MGAPKNKRFLKTFFLKRKCNIVAQKALIVNLIKNLNKVIVAIYYFLYLSSRQPKDPKQIYEKLLKISREIQKIKRVHILKNFIHLYPKMSSFSRSYSVKSKLTIKNKTQHSRYDG